MRPWRGGSLLQLVATLDDPVLHDADSTIVGAGRIVQYLEEGYPQSPLYPAAPARARVQMLEQWVDRVLTPAVQGARWLVATNLKRSWALLQAAYGAGADWLSPVLRPSFREFIAWRIEGAPSWFGRDAARLNRLARACDHLDGSLAETGWLVGTAASAADLFAYAALKPLEGLDGFETVRARKRIVGLMRGIDKRVGPAGEQAPAEVIDVAEAQAFVDARRLARPRSSTS